MQIIKQSLITIIICVVLLAGVNLIYAAWSGPPGPPPDPNAPAPINVSSVSQIKSGALQVNGFRNLGTTILDGNVGIGTTDPGTNKLQVNGKIQAIGGDICTDQGGGKCLSTAAGGGGTGTVTSVGTGAGLTGGPITTTGTISLNTAGINVAACTNGTGTGKIYWDTTNSRLGCGTDQIGAAGTGDITDVIAGNGLTGGASSGSATLNVGAGTGISVAADTVGLSYPSKSCSAGYAIQSLDLSSSASPACVSVTGASGVTSVTGSNGVTASPTTGAVGVSLTNSSKSCSAGQAIQSFNLGSSAVPTCVATGGTTGTLSCTTATCASTGACTATCPSGYIVTGCGCTIAFGACTNLQISGNGCYGNTGGEPGVSGTIQARCCKVQ